MQKSMDSKMFGNQITTEGGSGTPTYDDIIGEDEEKT